MERDVLFLLKEDFSDGPATAYFCPDCATVNGVLSYFPKLRHLLDIRYVDFPRPREDIVAILGFEHQGCPVLILATEPSTDMQHLQFGNVNGKHFLAGARKITEYWAAKYNVSRPH